MKVKVLIALLAKCDQEKDVAVNTQADLEAYSLEILAVIEEQVVVIQTESAER
jgi:hypothetical protein